MDSAFGQLGDDIVGDPLRPFGVSAIAVRISWMPGSVGRAAGSKVVRRASFDDDAPHRGLGGVVADQGVADRSALHGDDRVVAVAAAWCCREAGDVKGGNLARQPLDGDGGDVVAFNRLPGRPPPDR